MAISSNKVGNNGFAFLGINAALTQTLATASTKAAAKADDVADDVIKLAREGNDEALEAFAKQINEEKLTNSFFIITAVTKKLGQNAADFDDVIKKISTSFTKTTQSGSALAGTAAEKLGWLQKAWTYLASITVAGGFTALVGAVFLAAQIKAWVDEGGSSDDGGDDEGGGLFGGDSSTLLLWGGGAAVCILLVCMCLGLGAFLVMQGGNNNTNNTANAFKF